MTLGSCKLVLKCMGLFSAVPNIELPNVCFPSLFIAMQKEICTLCESTQGEIQMLLKLAGVL